MESSIHLCWSSEAELDELQLMGEGLKWGKKKVRVKCEEAVREAKVKEQQAEVRRANKDLKSKAKNVREATKSIPGAGKKFQTVMQEKNTQTYWLLWKLCKGVTQYSLHLA